MTGHEHSEQQERYSNGHASPAHSSDDGLIAAPDGDHGSFEDTVLL